MSTSKNRNVLFGFLVLMAVIALFSGCNKKTTGGGAAAGPDPYANAPREVSMTVLDRGAVKAEEGTYDDNRWVRWINENAPVKVTFVPVQRSQSIQIINTLFAAGSAPDVVWEYNKSFMDLLYNQGVIQPVGEYIDRYSVDYKQYLKENPDLMPYLIADDGKQYGITSRRNAVATLNHGFWIRKDWVDKFGMAMPTTLDEAVTFMRRVKAENPSGKVSWGMTTNQWWPDITNIMFGRPADDFHIENGHFVDWFSTPAYRDSLAFRALCYQEGLMDPEYITDTNYNRQGTLWRNGQAGIRFTGYSIQGNWVDLTREDPTVNMVPLEPLATKYGRFGYQTEVPFLKMVCMNIDARNPKAIMMYLDWLISGGYHALSWGLEGRHHRLVNGIPQIIDQELFRREAGYLSGNYEFALVDNNVMTPEWLPIQAGDDPLQQRYATLLGEFLNINQKFPYNREVPFGPSSPLITDFNVNTKPQIDAIETNIMIGRVSVDEGLRQINDYKRSMGWDAVNAEKDTWYQAHKAQFADWGKK